MHQVLVLNASYEPLNVCSDRRAHVLVWKGKAEVVEHHAQPLRSAERSFVRPHVIRLLQYVRVPRAVKRRISRRALFARDGWKCVYCGTAGGRLTLDHVIPRSKGGDSVWENVVTACAPCNLRKGDRLLEEVGDVAPSATASTGAGALHPPGSAARAGQLAPVPAVARAVRARGRLRRSARAAQTLRAAMPPSWSARYEPNTRSRAVRSRISLRVEAISGSSGCPLRTASKR